MKRRRSILRNQIAGLLDELGDDARQVAASLAAAGVQGTPRDAQDCAIARYVGAVVVADPRVRSVTVYNAGLAIRSIRRWRRPIDVPLPGPVRGFIVAFDAERFPALMRPNASPPLGPVPPGLPGDVVDRP
jgi:hypothetical protein